MTRDRPKAPIVVGVDGSEESRCALRWAAEEATLRRSPLEVVHVVHCPVGFGPTLYPVVNLEITAAGAEQFAAQVVDETLGRGARTRLRVQGGVGSAAEVLVHHASRAQLLVIGARGNTAIAELLLGSVGRHCVQHSPCPVVVVPIQAPNRAEAEHPSPGGET